MQDESIDKLRDKSLSKDLEEHNISFGTNVGFIGAGKVGFSLGKFFGEKGVYVTGYYSRHKESALEAAEFTHSECYYSLADLVKDSDTIFLTVPDGSITTVYEELTQFDISGKFICHCSGALSSAQGFPEAIDKGAYAYSVHPLFPVSNRLESYRELQDAFFCLEGSENHMNMVQSFLINLGLKTRVISGKDKIKYHAACAMASNLVCGVIAESLNMLGECGFTENESLEALAPLINSNIKHILEDGPENALTGPLERGDSVTVKKHIECMNSEMYIAVSKSMLSVAKKKNPDRDYSGIEKLLYE